MAGKNTGERSAAFELLGGLTEEMLLTADRGFYSFDLWCDADDSEGRQFHDVADPPQISPACR